MTRDDLRAALAAADVAPKARRARTLVDAPPAPAWEWSAEFSEAEREELAALRAAQEALRARVEKLEAEGREARVRERDLRAALAQLAQARAWRRRGVIATLRDRGLLG